MAILSADSDGTSTVSFRSGMRDYIEYLKEVAMQVKRMGKIRVVNYGPDMRLPGRRREGLTVPIGGAVDARFHIIPAVSSPRVSSTDFQSEHTHPWSVEDGTKTSGCRDPAKHRCGVCIIERDDHEVCSLTENQGKTMNRYRLFRETIISTQLDDRVSAERERVVACPGTVNNPPALWFTGAQPDRGQCASIYQQNIAFTTE